MKHFRFTNTSHRFSGGSESFQEDSVQFIHDTLSKLGIARKLAIKTDLLAEETIVQLMHHVAAAIRQGRCLIAP